MKGARYVHLAGPIRPTLEEGAATADGLLVVATRAYAALVAEMGSHEAAVEWLGELVERSGRPCYLHLPERSVAFAPASWSPERLAGYIAGHAPALQEAFEVDFTAIETLPAVGGTGEGKS